MFGYGSLIWRPDFPYIEAKAAYLNGYERRFWQGSHDHRGTPENPGRVVTLTPMEDARCMGKAYLIEPDVVTETFEQLDYREKNGYERLEVMLEFADATTTPALVYVAQAGNFAYAGEAPLSELAEIIARSHGPSGANQDYLFELASELRQFGVDEPHVFELEKLVRKLAARSRQRR